MPCQINNGRANGHSQMSRNSRLSSSIAPTETSPMQIATPIIGYNSHQFIPRSTFSYVHSARTQIAQLLLLHASEDNPCRLLPTGRPPTTAIFAQTGIPT